MMIKSTSEQENHNIAGKNATKNITYYSDLLLIEYRIQNIAKLLYIATPNEFLKEKYR